VTTRTRRNDLGQPSFGPAYEVLNLSSGDDSERTEVEGCVAVHDQVGMLPWSLGGRIGVLFGHPVGVGGGGDFTPRPRVPRRGTRVSTAASLPR